VGYNIKFEPLFYISFDFVSPKSFSLIVFTYFDKTLFRVVTFCTEETANNPELHDSGSSFNTQSGMWVRWMDFR